MDEQDRDFVLSHGRGMPIASGTHRWRGSRLDWRAGHPSCPKQHESRSGCEDDRTTAAPGGVVLAVRVGGRSAPGAHGVRSANVTRHTPATWRKPTMRRTEPVGAITTASAPANCPCSRQPDSVTRGGTLGLAAGGGRCWLSGGATAARILAGSALRRSLTADVASGGTDGASGVTEGGVGATVVELVVPWPAPAGGWTTRISKTQARRLIPTTNTAATRSTSFFWLCPMTTTPEVPRLSQCGPG